uniref:hypothetical protein n=1 Tax=uncultured Draconibacterium sp. TaxID=1573823 RepID=UPI0032165DA0
MTRFQKIGTFLGLFLMTAGLISCNDDDSTAPFEIIGDVLVNKRMQGDTAVVYANSYFAYGNQAMSVAKVQTPANETIELDPLDAYSQTYAAFDEFTSTPPTVGNYQFNVVFQDVPHQAIDILVYEDLDFPVFTNTEISNGTLTVEWEENTDTDKHMIRLLNEDGDIIYNSPLISSPNTRLDVSYSSGVGAWKSGYPNVDDVYTLELHGLLFEATSTEYDEQYNVQQASISEKEIIWE